MKYIAKTTSIIIDDITKNSFIFSTTDEQFREYQFEINSCFFKHNIIIDCLKSIRYSIKYNLPFCLSLRGDIETILIIANLRDSYIYCKDSLFLTLKNINYQILVRDLFQGLIKFKEKLYIWGDDFNCYHIEGCYNYNTRKNIIDKLIDEIYAVLLINKI